MAGKFIRKTWRRVVGDRYPDRTSEMPPAIEFVRVSTPEATPEERTVRAHEVLAPSTRAAASAVEPPPEDSVHLTGLPATTAGASMLPVVDESDAASTSAAGSDEAPSTEASISTTVVGDDAPPGAGFTPYRATQAMQGLSTHARQRAIDDVTKLMNADQRAQVAHNILAGLPEAKLQMLLSEHLRQLGPERLRGMYVRGFGKLPRGEQEQLITQLLRMTGWVSGVSHAAASSFASHAVANVFSRLPTSEQQQMAKMLGDDLAENFAELPSPAHSAPASPEQGSPQSTAGSPEAAAVFRPETTAELHDAVRVAAGAALCVSLRELTAHPGEPDLAVEHLEDNEIILDMMKDLALTGQEFASSAAKTLSSLPAGMEFSELRGDAARTALQHVVPVLEYLHANVGVSETLDYFCYGVIDCYERHAQTIFAPA